MTDKQNRVYVLRGTDSDVLPSCGGEVNELLGIYATRNAAEEAMKDYKRRHYDPNVTEWEVFV